MSDKHRISSNHKKNVPSGFTLIETLICLGILILLLPMAHHSFSNAWKKYQNLLIREKALLMAKMALSEEETRIQKGLRSPDSECIADPRLRCTRMVKPISAFVA